MFSKTFLQLLVISDLLEGQISCSAELSTKKRFITFRPVLALEVNYKDVRKQGHGRIHKSFLNRK